MIEVKYKFLKPLFERNSWEIGWSEKHMSVHECRSNRKYLLSLDSDVSFNPLHTVISSTIPSSFLALLTRWQYVILEVSLCWGKIRFKSMKKCLAWASNEMRQLLTLCLQKVLGYEIKICAENVHEHSEHVRDVCGLTTLHVSQRSFGPSQTSNLLGLLIRWRYIISGQNHVIQVPLMVAHCWHFLNILDCVCTPCTCHPSVQLCSCYWERR